MEAVKNVFIREIQKPERKVLVKRGVKAVSDTHLIKEVGLMCGYSDPNYFSRIFKKYEGMTPSEYRER